MTGSGRIDRGSIEVESDEGRQSNTVSQGFPNHEWFTDHGVVLTTEDGGLG